MSDAVPVASTPAVAAMRHGLRHLLSLTVPGVSLAFVATGPHGVWGLLGFFGLLSIFDVAEYWAPAETRQPPEGLPSWPFDGLLYGLFAMQMATIVLAAQLVSEVGLFSWNTLLLLLIVGASSGFSIITAHELIHRREKRFQWMGRVLMGLVLYEHFFTEHVRGHHRRVGTPEDPATARFGETYRKFWRRTVRAQFASAWRLETARLGDVDMKPWDPRIVRSRVLYGLVLEWAFAFGLLAVFGPAAFGVHLLQAGIAFSLLEAVNYFEHWGLVRTGPRVRARDSWDTTNGFTLYSLIGLSRHADHHAHASRPYPQLRHVEESPKLPQGYGGMVRMAIFRNAEFRWRMTHELRERGLGPYAPAAAGTLPPG
jgi:alkane 1-monooxygenase